MDTYTPRRHLIKDQGPTIWPIFTLVVQFSNCSTAEYSKMQNIFLGLSVSQASDESVELLCSSFVQNSGCSSQSVRNRDRFQIHFQLSRMQLPYSTIQVGWSLIDTKPAVNQFGRNCNWVLVSLTIWHASCRVTWKAFQSNLSQGKLSWIIFSVYGYSPIHSQRNHCKVLSVIYGKWGRLYTITDDG